MEGTSIQSHCEVCYENISYSDSVTRVRDILDILKALVNTNVELLQDALMCEPCVAKFQSAYKFKILYLERYQKTLEQTIVKKEIISEELMCGMCKKHINPNDCIPFLESVTSKLILRNHLSTEFVMKLPENLQTCEECHKSLLNFCTVINSIPIFEQSGISNINKLGDISELREFQHLSDGINSSKCTENIKTDIKEENVDWFQDEKDKHCTLHVVKNEDEYEDDTLQEFMLKNEEVDLKSEGEEEDKERNWKYEAANLYSSTNEKHSFNLNITNDDSVKDLSSTTSKFKAKIEKTYQCLNCKFQTRHRSSLIQHKLLHKDKNDVKLYRCNNCDYHSKYKNSLKVHMLTHKNKNYIQLFHCETCNFRTKFKGFFKQHMLDHRYVNDIVIFRCDVCDYKSIHKSTLEQHMLKHQSTDVIQMFQCKLCDFQTRLECYLKQHFNSKRCQRKRNVLESN